ncbi:MAG: DnaK suppressor protein [Solirubrobacteraceae bacterium]|nr:DnaK suppressor protein [Solirubrobacteraceae bacterium]
MDSIDQDTAREGLQRRLQELEARIAAMAAPPEAGSTIGFGKRIGDGTIEAVSRLTDVGVGRGLETQQARIVRALEKLDEGTYGLCDRCGEPIAPARLAAAPDSVHCIACARLVVRPGATRR